MKKKQKKFKVYTVNFSNTISEHRMITYNFNYENQSNENKRNRQKNKGI